MDAKHGVYGILNNLRFDDKLKSNRRQGLRWRWRDKREHIKHIV